MNVIFTTGSAQDKNAQSYFKAIIREAAKRDIVVNASVAHDQTMMDSFVNSGDKFLVMEPCEFKYDTSNPNNLEMNITAKVIASVCNEIKERSRFSTSVLIANRSKLIGRPLMNMLLDENYTISVVHSYTDKYNVDKYVNTSDIVVLATGHDMTHLKLDNNHVIDASNDYKGKESSCMSYVSMSEIGRRTVKILLDQVKK